MKIFLMIFIIVINIFAVELERIQNMSIVYDRTNNLIWQDLKNQKLMDISNAKQYCSDFEIGRFKNWRLPTIEELESIIDYKKASIKHEFKNVEYPFPVKNDILGLYWTKDKLSNSKKFYFVVDFYEGGSFSSSSKNYTRCVHPHNLDGKITKLKQKKVIWEDTSYMPRDLTWNEAKKYCENLTEDGFDNWTLPSIEDLKSLRDKYKFNPAIKDSIKYVHTKMMYWSDTQYSRNKNYVYVANFLFGQVSLEDKFFKNNVRCIRSIKHN